MRKLWEENSSEFHCASRVVSRNERSGQPIVRILRLPPTQRSRTSKRTLFDQKTPDSPATTTRTHIHTYIMAKGGLIAWKIQTIRQRGPAVSYSNMSLPRPPPGQHWIQDLDSISTPVVDKTVAPGQDQTRPPLHPKARP